MRDLLFEGVYDQGILKAVILSGGPGSGKSTVSSRVFGIPNGLHFAPSGLKVLNSDRAFEHLLRKNGLDLDLAHMPIDVMVKVTDKLDPNSLVNQSRRITEEMYRRYTESKLGIIMDTTGQNGAKIKMEKEELEEMGYDVQMVFVNTPLEIALERNRSRERKMPDAMVEQIWNKSQANLKSFQEVFGAAMTVVDNSGPQIDQVLERQITRFVAEPIRNPVGRAWVEQSIPAHQHKQARHGLNGRVKNPETGHNILVKTALSYPKEHPAHKAAVKQLAAHYNPLAGRIGATLLENDL